jgi:hypothetical protein
MSLQVTQQINHCHNSLFLGGYLTTLLVIGTIQNRMTGLLINWKASGMKRSWPNRRTIPVFAWKD